MPIDTVRLQALCEAVVRDAKGYNEGTVPKARDEDWARLTDESLPAALAAFIDAGIPEISARTPSPCPFCLVPADFAEYTVHSSYNHKGEVSFHIRDRKAQSVSCGNVRCSVRPRVERIETGDAIEIWNRGYATLVAVAGRAQSHELWYDLHPGDQLRAGDRIMVVAANEWTRWSGDRPHTIDQHTPPCQRLANPRQSITAHPDLTMGYPPPHPPAHPNPPENYPFLPSSAPLPGTLPWRPEPPDKAGWWLLAVWNPTIPTWEVKGWHLSEEQARHRQRRGPNALEAWCSMDQGAPAAPAPTSGREGASNPAQAAIKSAIRPRPAAPPDPDGLIPQIRALCPKARGTYAHMGNGHIVVLYECTPLENNRVRTRYLGTAGADTADAAFRKAAEKALSRLRAGSLDLDLATSDPVEIALVPRADSGAFWD